MTPVGWTRKSDMQVLRVYKQWQIWFLGIRDGNPPKVSFMLGYGLLAFLNSDGFWFLELVAFLFKALRGVVEGVVSMCRVLEEA